VAPPGNQAVNGENKPQPAVSGETGLLDSIILNNILERGEKRTLSKLS
jgi:hypothetical protein